MIRGLMRYLKEPKTADMRSPVTLVKSARTPDMGDGFTTRYTKQYDAWAKFVSASGQPVFGESIAPQDELTHVMIIRHTPPQPTPELDWKVVYDNKLYAILDVQWVTDRKFFLALGLNDQGPLDGQVYDDDRTEENPNDPEAPADEPAPAHDGFPFWGD